MKHIKTEKAPTNGKGALVIGPDGDLIDATLSPSPRQTSGKSGWIVGGLDQSPLPTERERKEWAKKFNGGSQSAK